jgi:regulatory protein
MPSTSPPSAYAKAVQLLAGRAHFRAELATKLARRGYPAEEIEAALDRLTREGYLDDRQTAMEFTAARLAKGDEGRRRLRAELARRGVGSEAAEEAVTALAPEDDLPAARAAAARKIGRRAGGPLSQPELASLARHLERKGFSRRAIVAVLKEQPGGTSWSTDEGDG